MRHQQRCVLAQWRSTGPSSHTACALVEGSCVPVLPGFLPHQRRLVTCSECSGAYGCLPPNQIVLLSQPITRHACLHYWWLYLQMRTDSEQFRHCLRAERRPRVLLRLLNTCSLQTAAPYTSWMNKCAHGKRAPALPVISSCSDGFTQLHCISSRNAGWTRTVCAGRQAGHQQVGTPRQGPPLHPVLSTWQLQRRTPFKGE